MSAALLTAGTMLSAKDVGPTVVYTPFLKLVEGDQPVNTSYVLSVKSPPNVLAGSNLSISPVLSVVSTPAGVSTATALSFVSFSPSTLVFTGPDQVQTTTVTVDVPVGTEAGDYIWAISTPGWPTGTIDLFAFINAKITIPQVPVAPTVHIDAPLDGSVYTYVAGGPAVSIPLSFTASATTVSPIFGIDADVGGAAVILSSSGLGSDAVTATGTIQISQAGLYTVRARATNNVNTSSDTVEITVNLQVPPPVVTLTTPPAGDSYIYSGAALSIPFSFNATTLSGSFTSLSATLNGNPVAVTPGGLATLNATGTGTLSINASGSYVLAVTATTPYGTSSASRTITVSAASPPPSLTIAAPVNGSVITRVTGSAPTSVPFDFTATAAPGATISGLTGSLNVSSLVITPTGLGTATARGRGNMLVSAPGTYTFVAGATSGGTSAARSVSFTVQETPPQPNCGIEWLPPISLGKVQKGGSTLPIKFKLDCRVCGGKGHHHDDNHHDGDDDDERDGDDDDDDDDHDSCRHERDTSVIIAIYKVGSSSAPVLFTFSRTSPNAGHYTINSNGMYHLNYRVPKGAGTYHIDVFHSSSTPQLLGTKEFTAR